MAKMNFDFGIKKPGKTGSVSGVDGVVPERVIGENTEGVVPEKEVIQDGLPEGSLEENQSFNEGDDLSQEDSQSLPVKTSKAKQKPLKKRAERKLPKTQKEGFVYFQGNHYSQTSGGILRPIPRSSMKGNSQSVFGEHKQTKGIKNDSLEVELKSFGDKTKNLIDSQSREKFNSKNEYGNKTNDLTTKEGEARFENENKVYSLLTAYDQAGNYSESVKLLGQSSLRSSLAKGSQLVSNEVFFRKSAEDILLSNLKNKKESGTQIRKTMKEKGKEVANARREEGISDQEIIEANKEYIRASSLEAIIEERHGEKIKQMKEAESRADEKNPIEATRVKKAYQYKVINETVMASYIEDLNNVVEGENVTPSDDILEMVKNLSKNGEPVPSYEEILNKNTETLIKDEKKKKEKLDKIERRASSQEEFTRDENEVGIKNNEDVTGKVEAWGMTEDGVFPETMNADRIKVIQKDFSSTQELVGGRSYTKEKGGKVYHTMQQEVLFFYKTMMTLKAEIKAAGTDYNYKDSSISYGDKKRFKNVYITLLSNPGKVEELFSLIKDYEGTQRYSSNSSKSDIKKMIINHNKNIFKASFDDILDISYNLKDLNKMGRVDTSSLISTSIGGSADAFLVAFSKKVKSGMVPVELNKRLNDYIRKISGEVKVQVENSLFLSKILYGERNIRQERRAGSVDETMGSIKDGEYGGFIDNSHTIRPDAEDAFGEGILDDKNSRIDERIEKEVKVYVKNSPIRILAENPDWDGKFPENFRSYEEYRDFYQGNIIGSETLSPHRVRYHHIVNALVEGDVNKLTADDFSVVDEIIDTYRERYGGDTQKALEQIMYDTERVYQSRRWGEAYRGEAEVNTMVDMLITRRKTQDTRLLVESRLEGKDYGLFSQNVSNFVFLLSKAMRKNRKLMPSVLKEPSSLFMIGDKPSQIVKLVLNKESNLGFLMRRIERGYDDIRTGYLEEGDKLGRDTSGFLKSLAVEKDSIISALGKLSSQENVENFLKLKKVEERGIEKMSLRLRKLEEKRKIVPEENKRAITALDASIRITKKTIKETKAVLKSIENDMKKEISQVGKDTEKFKRLFPRIKDLEDKMIPVDSYKASYNFMLSNVNDPHIHNPENAFLANNSLLFEIKDGLSLLTEVYTVIKKDGKINDLEIPGRSPEDVMDVIDQLKKDKIIVEIGDEGYKTVKTYDMEFNNLITKKNIEHRRIVDETQKYLDLYRLKKSLGENYTKAIEGVRSSTIKSLYIPSEKELLEKTFSLNNITRRLQDRNEFSNNELHLYTSKIYELRDDLRILKGVIADERAVGKLNKILEKIDESLSFFEENGYYLYDKDIEEIRFHKNEKTDGIRERGISLVKGLFAETKGFVKKNKSYFEQSAKKVLKDMNIEDAKNSYENDPDNAKSNKQIGVALEKDLKMLLSEFIGLEDAPSFKGLSVIESLNKMDETKRNITLLELSKFTRDRLSALGSFAKAKVKYADGRFYLGLDYSKVHKGVESVINQYEQITGEPLIDKRGNKLSRAGGYSPERAVISVITDNLMDAKEDGLLDLKDAEAIADMGSNFSKMRIHKFMKLMVSSTYEEHSNIGAIKEVIADFDDRMSKIEGTPKEVDKLVDTLVEAAYEKWKKDPSVYSFGYRAFQPIITPESRGVSLGDDKLYLMEDLKQSLRQFGKSEKEILANIMKRSTKEILLRRNVNNTSSYSEEISSGDGASFEGDTGESREVNNDSIGDTPSDDIVENKSSMNEDFKTDINENIIDKEADEEITRYYKEKIAKEKNPPTKKVNESFAYAEDPKNLEERKFISETMKDKVSFDYEEEGNKKSKKLRASKEASVKMIKNLDKQLKNGNIKLITKLKPVVKDFFEAMLPTFDPSANYAGSTVERTPLKNGKVYVDKYHTFRLFPKGTKTSSEIGGVILLFKRDPKLNKTFLRVIINQDYNGS